MSDLKFVHIPKTGGTSIETAAKELGINWGKYERQNQYLIHGINKWHTPQRIEGVVFCVVRNPYERILSNFRHLHQITQYKVDILNTWIPKILQQVKENPYLRDAHFLQQSEYAQHCDIHLLYNDLQRELDWVCDLHGAPKMVLPHHFGGPEQDIKRGGQEYYQFVIEDISSENLGLIKEFYSKDFELFDKVYQEWLQRHV
jgi:hypothetical protein